MREESSVEGNCCNGLFDAFEFTRFQDAEPPKRKGVYVIRIHRRGTPAEEVREKAVALAESIGWDMAGRFLCSRLNRLSKIGDCPTIYIGSAGTYAGSKNTLHGRYRELATRHTAKYPVWALLSSRWELQYGWMIVDEHPGAVEEVLKKRYRGAQREAACAGDPMSGARLIQDNGTLPAEHPSTQTNTHITPPPDL